MTDAHSFPTHHTAARHLAWLRIRRTPLKALGWRRLLIGGRISDLGRLPRYTAIFLLGASALWAPIVGYLSTAPLKYTSYASLILPGSGASASVNLNDIGQASSFANSAFSNGSVSPTETYKRLLGADRILDAAARSLDVDLRNLDKPRVTLVDQTSLMHIEVNSQTPEAAQRYGDALLAAFFTEIDALRADEIKKRQDSGTGAMEDYTRSVQETRAQIAKLQVKSGLESAQQYRDQVAANDALKQSIRVLAGEVENQNDKVRALEAALDLPPNSAAETLKLYADAEYLALLDDVAVQAAELANTKSTYGARHPVRVASQAAYDQVRAAARARAMEVTGFVESQLNGLDRAPEGQRASLLSDLVRENALLAGLQKEIGTLTAKADEESLRLDALSPVAAELEDKQRDFAVAEAVFASAIARTESTKTDVFASYPLIQVLENPSLPDSPSSPRRKLALAAGIAATFMLIVGLTLAWVRKPLISRLINSPETRADA